MNGCANRPTHRCSNRQGPAVKRPVLECQIRAAQRCRVMPPSTETTWPVIMRALSEA